MLTRLVVVILNSYLLSGIMLAPIVIVATAMHARIERRRFPTLVGWGAAAIVFLAYLAKLPSAL